jgi:hypothetical protein
MQESEGRGWCAPPVVKAERQSGSANCCLGRTETHRVPARAAPHWDRASAGNPCGGQSAQSRRRHHPWILTTAFALLGLDRRNLKKVHQLAEINRFMKAGPVTLRAYQQGVAEAVVNSVTNKAGLSLVVMFPRQSGKNELQAQLEAYLLWMYSNKPAEIVKVSPTWRPQSMTSMRRLERVLKANKFTATMWQRESGYIFRVGEARIYFLSGAGESNIVGATASLLLEVDEAQAVAIDKFDREVAPMAAASHATRVFWGTAWTAQTLLARELRASQAEEARDQVRRVFRVSAEEVAAEVPEYGSFVAEQVARLGRMNLTVRTQYFSEEIDAEAGLFPTQRLALMEGGHAWQERPQAGETYAFLLDVGGEENVEEKAAGGREHDATALVIVAVERGGLLDPGVRAPRYRVVNLMQWRGEGHARLHSRLTALARAWNPRRLVVDATGLGAGLAAFLENSLPGRVLRYEFNTLTKSRLGWGFVEVVESGRFHLPRAAEAQAEKLVDLFRAQCRACQYRVGQRPAQALHWGVPEGARDPSSGELLHDDLLLAAALCARLDNVDWPLAANPDSGGVIQAKDPLEGNERF